MRRRLVAGAVILAVLALVVVWWRRSGDQRPREIAPPVASTREGERGAGSARAASARGADPRQGGRRVTGRVVAGERPVAATVWIAGLGMNPHVYAEVTAGADGTFELRGLPARKLALSAGAPDHVGRRIDVDLKEGDREGLVVRLGTCERTLTGNVLDASGAAIAGARVVANEWSLHDVGFAITGADGRYRMCAPNVQLVLEVRAEGYASEQRRLAPGSGGTDVVLRPEAVLAGTTVDPKGARVPFALVVAAADHGTGGEEALGASTTSDADGVFEVRGLGAGDYHVRASTPELATAAPVDTSIELGVTNTLEVVLEPAGEIRGRALLEDKRPAADVEIVWLHHTARRATARTDATGAFVITGAAFGDGAFFATGYALPKGPKLAGASPVELVLPVLTDSTIRGRVVRNGTPVAGARVLDITIATYDVARSHDDGTFEVERFAGGATLVAESDELGLSSEPVAVSVSPGQTRDGVELVLSRGGALTGTVVDEAGTPVVGAAVTLRPAGTAPPSFLGSRVRAQAMTRDDGGFRVAMLPAGEHVVEIDLSGKALDIVKGPDTVTIGTTLITARVVVAVRRVKFAGQVVDDRGAPVPDASLELRAGGSIQVRRADTAGRFVLEAVESTRYTIMARGKPGTDTVVHDLTPGVGLRIQLVTSGKLKFVCQPAGAEVRVFLPSNAILRSACGRTLARVPAGSVFAQVEDLPEGEAVPMAKGEVVAGTETSLALVPVGERAVELRVQRNGAPVAKALCAIDLAFGSTLSTNRMYVTDANGTATARAPNLPARLRCAAPGRAFSPARTVVPDESNVVLEVP